MKILVLGAAGQVGFELQRSLAPLGEVVPATRQGRLPSGGKGIAMDLSAPAQLPVVLDALRPDVIVNAAAYTAVDRAESEPELARTINTQAPAVLARWCQINQTRLLHYSTDYVFDGSANRPWREDDRTAPLNVYGRSKRDGELAIIGSDCAYLILRTGWVYAARGSNFLRTMLRLGGEREILRVVDDQIGAPTPARWIAAATAAILARTQTGAPWQSGLLHLSAAGHTSWHGFAEAIFTQAIAAGVLDHAPRLEAITTSAYPTPARRPVWSCLDNSRLREHFGLALPDWHQGLTEVMGELAQ